MSRLIDADDFKTKLEELQPNLDLLASMCVDEVIGLIDEQPTAYDVDKVVEKLEKLPIYEFGVTLLNTEEYVKLSDLKQAIDIVKRGGVNG